MVDQSIAEYVERLTALGYTEAQIKDALKRHGYPTSLIRDALRERGNASWTVGQPSGMNPLDAYLQQYLSQGYNLAQLRTYLLDQGHSRREVDAAIRRVTGATVTHAVHLPVVILLLLIVGALAGGWFYLHLQTTSVPTDNTGQSSTPPERLLDLQVSVDRLTAHPGETVTPTISVINMGDHHTFDVHLDVSLIDEEGVTWTSVEFTRAIATSVESTRPFLIPDEVSPGRYELKVVARYGGEMPAIASSPLKIVAEDEPTGPGTQPSGTQPGSSDGQEPFVLPPPKKKGFDATVKEATGLAEKGDRQGASEACASLEDTARDVCFSTLVLVDPYPPYCEVIKSQREQENCFMVFVLQGELSYCDRMKTPENVNQCNNLKLIYQLTHSPPQGTPEATSPPGDENAHPITRPDLNELARPAGTSTT